jgi:hypothetical protein
LNAPLNATARTQRTHERRARPATRRRNVTRRRWTLVASCLILGALAAHIEIVRPAIAVSNAFAQGDDSQPSCVEKVPEGRTSPVLKSELPTTGTVGHLLPLTLSVEHGKGETVFPHGMDIELSSNEAEALARAGFVVPSSTSEARPTRHTEERNGVLVTTVELPLIPLPPKQGRHELALPELPVLIARASGELITLCTAPHEVTVDQPTANTSNPAPKANPPAERQLEVWDAAQTATLVGACILAALLVALVLFLWWRRRPKPVPPPPPARPPWDLALEELAEIRKADYPNHDESARHVDEVSNALRRYLGGRYRAAFGSLGEAGALESTTGEIMGALRRIASTKRLQPDVEAVLNEADLVKFAKATPSGEDCLRTLTTAEKIVRGTTPVQRVEPQTESGSGDTPGRTPRRGGDS